MWMVVRSFYGPRSIEAKSVDELSTFSRILLGEWRIGASRSKQPTNDSMDPRSKAAMTIKQIRLGGGSPGSRSEKRPASSMMAQGQQSGPAKRTAEEQQKYYANLIKKGITNKDASKAFGDRLEQQEQLRKRPKLDVRRTQSAQVISKGDESRKNAPEESISTFSAGKEMREEESPEQDATTKTKKVDQVMDIPPVGAEAIVTEEETAREATVDLSNEDKEASRDVAERAENHQPASIDLSESAEVASNIAPSKPESAMSDTLPQAGAEVSATSSSKPSGKRTALKEVSPKAKSRKKAASSRASNRGRAPKRQTRAAVKA